MIEVSRIDEKNKDVSSKNDYVSKKFEEVYSNYEIN